MHKKFSKKLSEAFVTVCDCYQKKNDGQPYSKLKLYSALSYIDDAARRIDKTSDDNERDFMFSCLGAFDEIIKEGDLQKISRYAHAVHRIPFLFCGDEKWNDEFRSTHILPFCRTYGDEWFSEILDMHVSNKSAKTKKGKTIYRYNEMNVMSLPAYFCFRMLIPLLTLPFIIGCMIYVQYDDYSEKNPGTRYEITVTDCEYENTGKYDYLYINCEEYAEQFEISRFFQYSNSPEKLIDKCQKGETLIVYAEYVKPKKFDNYYKVAQLEDTDGNVYRTYSQTNQQDKYVMTFLQIAFLTVFIPFFILFVLMLAIAVNPRRFISCPRFVKFCFPDYSLKLVK